MMKTIMMMLRKSPFFFGIAALILVSAPAQRASAQPVLAAIPKITADPLYGEKLYEAQCGGCHWLDGNRIGPMHRGVVGCLVASIATYSYSRTPKRSELFWAPANLDLWLIGATRLVPGTRVAAFVAILTDRSDIIAWLASTSLPTKK